MSSIIGTPEVDAGFFDGIQSYPDTCAIRCQEAIIQQFLGRDIDEHFLVQQAKDIGVYTGQGTLPVHVGALLEMYGIEVNRKYDANLYDMTMALSEGKKIIVGVDSGELWEKDIFNQAQERLEDAYGLHGCDHAVIVCGVDTSDPDNIMVLIADPGTGEKAAAYPIENFLDAWKDSNFLMVSTCDPAPHWLPEMVHFDYNEGHLPYIGHVPYSVIAGTDPIDFSQNGLVMFAEHEDYDLIDNQMHNQESIDSVEEKNHELLKILDQSDTEKSLDNLKDGQVTLDLFRHNFDEAGNWKLKEILESDSIEKSIDAGFLDLDHDGIPDNVDDCIDIDGDGLPDIDLDTDFD